MEYAFFLLLFLFIFLKCKAANTVMDGADRSVDIVNRLTRHLCGGEIYKRKNKKTKDYTRFGGLKSLVQRLRKKIAPLLSYSTRLIQLNIQESATSIGK